MHSGPAGPLSCTPAKPSPAPAHPQEWHARGPPASFWLPGFFFAQCFLTAALQDYARRAVVPVDAVDFDVIPLPPAAAHGAGPGQGPGTDPGIDPSRMISPGGSGEGVVVHGLFLEGARWDDEGMCLAESAPKVRAPQLMATLHDASPTQLCHSESALAHA